MDLRFIYKWPMHSDYSFPNVDIIELPDGKYLVRITQEGETPTEMVIDPRFGLFLGQRLTSTFLGRKMESTVPLEAVQ